MTAAKRKSSKPPVPIWSRPTVWLSAAIVFVCLVWGIVGCIEQAAGADVSVKCKAAAVRVYTDDVNGSHSMGSGVIVKDRRRHISVNTAAHVVRDAKRVWFHYRGRWVPCRVLKIDVKWDVAALDATGCDPADAVELHVGPPAIGTRVRVCGFTSGGPLTCRPGQVVDYRAPQAGATRTDWMNVNAPAWGGDSGGPILTEDGKLAGVLWGSDHRTGTAATQPGKLEEFMADLPAMLPQSMKFQLASLPVAPTYTPTAILPGQKKYQGKVLQGLENINRGMAQTPAPSIPTPALSPPAAACPAPDLSPIITAIEQQGEATRAAIAEAVTAKQQAEPAEEKPSGLKGKIHANLEEDAEEGGLKGKIAEKLLRWEERGQMGVWAAIVGGIVLLVYWHKNKHGPVAGVLERVGRPELAERETEIVEKLESRIKGAVAAAATANPAVGLAVSEAEKVEQRLKEFLEARLKPAPGQQPPTQPPAQA